MDSSLEIIDEFPAPAKLGAGSSSSYQESKHMDIEILNDGCSTSSSNNNNVSYYS